MKRVAVISDLHCGHKYGLTPPNWQQRIYSEVQRPLWDWYERETREIGKVDVLVVNGDAVDGVQYRSQGVELIEGDQLRQVSMAKECIKAFDATKTILVIGTAYHTGQNADFEEVLANELDSEIYEQFVLEVNPFDDPDISRESKVYIDFKHHVGGSSIPHGRATAVLRARLWESIKSLRDGSPRPNIVVRSHVHYHVVIDDADGLAVVTPALQVGSRFGSRRCDGTTDLGFILFEISANVETMKPVITLKRYLLEESPLQKAIVEV